MKPNHPPISTILMGFESRTKEALAGGQLSSDERNALLNRLVNAACLAYREGYEGLGDSLLGPVIAEGLPPQSSTTPPAPCETAA